MLINGYMTGLEWSQTCPKDIEDAIIEANGGDLEIEINSPGGDVYTGSEIYTLLKGYSGKVTGHVMGVAASAASVIAMACNPLKISPTAQIMIHNVRSTISGDHRDLQHGADFLRGWDKSIANAYILKTGMDQKELLKLMDKETWLNAQQAKEMGFVDEIMFDDGQQLVASADVGGVIPVQVINKFINELGGKNLGTLSNRRELINDNNQINQNKGVDNNMTLEELKNNNPELYNQIFNAGKEAGIQEGAKQERIRIQKIDEISNNIDPDLVHKAKYVELMNAETLAFEAIKADKAKGQQYLNNAITDSSNSGVQNVTSSLADDSKDEKPKTVNEKFKNIAANLDARRRGVNE